MLADLRTLVAARHENGAEDPPPATVALRQRHPGG